MKARTFLIAILASCLLASCIDVTEELFLTKKGSGKYIMTMDLSGIMDLANLSDMLGEGEENTSEESDQEDENTIEEEVTKEPKGEGLDGLFGSGETSMDTIFNFYDMEDEKKQNLSNPEILKKGFMRIKMDEEKKEAIMSFIVEYDKLSDINDFFNAFAEMGAEENEESLSGLGGMLGMREGFGDKDLFSLSKRVLTRTTIPSQYNELLEGEDAAFAKMMFKGARHTTIYHLPGRVKSTTIPNARVDGKTLTIENSFLDVMEEKVNLDGQIKFRRR